MAIHQETVKAKAEMLIRKPVEEVFEAFIDPQITSKFWFTKGSGKLEVGKEVCWVWEMYNFSVLVRVKAIEKNKRILIEWEAFETPTMVEWIFTPHSADATFVCVSNSGFNGYEDDIIHQAIASTEGFSFVLAGIKAYLEHNIQLNLVADRFPEGINRKDFE